MKFEVLKRNHLKRNIIIGIIVVLILSAIILTFTRAKYRVTQSVPLVSGTINFSPYDFNVVAMYLNKGDETLSTTKVPHVGYTLNEEQSSCVVDGQEDENSQIVYENSYLYFNQVSWSGTKCSVYFDLIPDSENPVINNMVAVSFDDSSVTINVNATDNIGIFYYYYKLGNGEEVQSEEATYTFDGLTKDQTYTVNVRVEDAAGNSVSDSRIATVGYSAGRFILANEGGENAIVAKGTPNFTQTATTDEGMYAAEDDFGTSYYYRGAVNDNWMYFGGFYWRIIRVNGNGTVRLIYNGNSADSTSENTIISNSNGYFNSPYNDNMYVGYMYGSNSTDYVITHANINNSTSKVKIDSWYQTNLAKYSIYLDGSAGFCGDRTPSTSSSSINGFGGTGTTTTYYGAYVRLYVNHAPTLRCTNKSDLYTTVGSGYGNESLNYPIGLITADEAWLAGGTNDSNEMYYLYTNRGYWTLSPEYFSGFASVFVIYSDGSIRDFAAVYQALRPVINLRSDVALTGSGTTDDPYRLAE